MFQSNSNWASRNPTRDFSPEVKQAEFEASSGCCRICGTSSSSDSSSCGSSSSGEFLQFAHILSHSLSFDWMRVGTELFEWKDDDFVKSLENCLLLCKPHHSQCDSKEGLKACTVSYMKSLKNNTKLCTALTKSHKRCSKSRIQDSFRCSTHSKSGGVESSLSVEQWTRTQTLPMLKSVTKSGKLDSFSVVNGREPDDGKNKTQNEFETVQGSWLDSVVYDV